MCGAVTQPKTCVLFALSRLAQHRPAPYRPMQNCAVPCCAKHSRFLCQTADCTHPLTCPTGPGAQGSCTAVELHDCHHYCRYCQPYCHTAALLLPRHPQKCEACGTGPVQHGTGSTAQTGHAIPSTCQRCTKQRLPVLYLANLKKNRS